MSTTNLVTGSPWTIRAADSVPTTSHFNVLGQVAIDGDSISVTASGATEPELVVSGSSFTIDSTQMAATYVFLDTDDKPIRGIVQCIPGTKGSAVIGGTTKEDPNTVAVWGGDDGQ